MIVFMDNPNMIPYVQSKFPKRNTVHFSYLHVTCVLILEPYMVI